MIGYWSTRFWVDGEPVSQGSMRSPKAGVVIHDSAKLKGWRDAIAWAAKESMYGQPMLDQPVDLTCTFIFSKPKKPHHPHYADTALDLDKLIRAVGDALQGVVVKNDARIVRVSSAKLWTGTTPFTRPTPGVYVSIETVGEDWPK